MPLVRKRVEAVRQSRLSSSAKATVQKADTPTLFFTITQPQTGMMLVGRFRLENGSIFLSDFIRTKSLQATNF